ncbi:MAG: EAL domain-containing protein, partial [Micromonosporaceae bacterium]|nr:EAL domain-containing protein [Micromonosporaceae bacterium]
GAVHLCNRNAGRVFGIAGERDRDHDPCRSQDQGPDGETGHRSLIPPAALAGKALVDFEVNGWQRPDGSRVDLTISTAAVPGTDQVVAVVCDVTDRRRMQDQLRRQALHDELTGLANRTLFLDKIAGALASSASMADPTAVLLLDLDAFKTVNDTLGHAAGDLLLVEVAERLRVCLRPQDTLARLGGDEFAVLLKSSGQAEAAMVAKRVLAAFEQPIRICSAEEATTEVRVRVSLGAVVAERETEADASALLRSADMAMYAAKRAGGHRWAVFEPAMQQRLRERVALEEALRRAVVAEGLRLYYQPCVDLDTAEIRSAEALLRWTDPGRGAVPPRQFIPIAEDTGMIVQIGRWALQEACRQASGWQTPTGSSLTVAVNLSVRQLTDPSLVNDIRDALTESGLPAQCLVLELTESELADDTVLPVLRHLKALGVRLALDDFGTGYSSLAYLRRFPLDILKIDRAFVTPITSDPSAAALTRSIIDMAHTLGLETVAEGVESEEQAALLRGMECQRAQGFLFARPQPPDVLAAELLRRANHQVAPG